MPLLRNSLSLFALLAASGIAQLSNAPFQHAQEDLAKIKLLVEQGALPRSTLEEAERKLADAQDQATLSDTLYSATHAQDMTKSEEDDMLAAATRRVDRAQMLVDERQKLLQMGIISQSEMTSVRTDLNSRRLVLDLARNRIKLNDELRQIVADEQRLAAMHTVENSMIRYEGNADFRLEDLALIQKNFKSRFHHDLPVSALGQTTLHQSMGLDHRNKVDVALNPEQPEGLWLRQYLEKSHYSYLAFRTAVIGAATAPHIHIGTGSTRLGLAAHAPAAHFPSSGKLVVR